MSFLLLRLVQGPRSSVLSSVIPDGSLLLHVLTLLFCVRHILTVLLLLCVIATRLCLYVPDLANVYVIAYTWSAQMVSRGLETIAHTADHD